MFDLFLLLFKVLSLIRAPALIDFYKELLFELKVLWHLFQTGCQEGNRTPTSEVPILLQYASITTPDTENGARVFSFSSLRSKITQNFFKLVPFAQSF